MTIGTLIEMENCQISGPDLQDCLYWNRNHQMGIHGPGGDWRENKRPPDQALCGQRCVKICPMHRNAKRSKSGRSRDRRSTMPEDCVVFTLLIQMMRNSRISWNTRVESCKFRCQSECLVKLHCAEVAGKPVALKLLKPMNLRGSAWKDLLERIMKIILQEKGCIHGVTTIWCASLFLCLKQWKFQMERQQWRNNWKNWRKSRHGSWRKSETRKKWSKKQGMRAKKYILRHWWISVISRIRSWSRSTKNTKVESYFEVTLWKMIPDHTQCSLNKDHRHLQWQPQESWTQHQGFQDVQDKQLMQYLLITRSKWKMLQNYWKFRIRNVQTFGFVYQNTNG